jgi:hypothetical protein
MVLKGEVEVKEYILKIDNGKWLMGNGEWKIGNRR